VSITIAPMTWSPKKVGGSKRSIIERDTMKFTKVFDNEKKEEIIDEQNNHPLMVNITQTKERNVVEVADARAPQM
jgi:hypothetical protein